MRARSLVILLVALSSSMTSVLAFGQDQSAYDIAFSTEVSKLLLNSMTFPDQQPLELSGCSTTLKINGPLACALDCSQTPVCLMSFQGEAGHPESDFLQFHETPLGSSPASPSGTPSPGSSLSVAP